jgi:hypothetical protein
MAFGVDRDASGSGLDALTLRRIIMGKWHNTGVTTGLKCTGRSDLKYNVSAGMAVCSMSAADGYTEAYWGGGTTENAVAAGDGTYARIDTVYMLSNTGSPDNLVHVAVKQGTPAATPTRPTLPSGALELLSFRMPAGGSATSSATALDTYHYAIPYGGNLGRLGFVSDSSQDELPIDSKWHQQLALKTIVIPTDRLVEIWWTARAITKNTVAADYGVRVLVDGSVADDGVLDQVPVVNHTTTQSIRLTTVLAGGAAHTVTFETIGDYGAAVVWSGNRSGEARDIGVAQ